MHKILIRGFPNGTETIHKFFYYKNINMRKKEQDQEWRSYMQ